MQTAIIEANNIVKDFEISRQGLQRKSMRALNDVSFKLHKGRALAIVGESGSGKSTVAKIVAKMHKANAGQVLFNQRDINEFKGRKAELEYRSNVQMVFQDPFGSLNPVHTIFHHVARPLLLHNKFSKHELRDKVEFILEQVGLNPASETAQKYPHQLSGGQRQRVNIARNLAVGAQVMLADEPTSMLDVSIRLGILNLMEEMKSEQDLAMMYITHDIATARYLAEDIGVMYVGHMLEWGDTDEVIHHPQHPYTQLLVSAVPNPEQSIHGGTLAEERGEIPLWTPHSRGCPFAGRCKHVSEQCRQQLPPVVALSERHFVRCFLHS
ncbi:ABC transporter ATP-binding protein [Alginatibacterium sediminis]|uniref:ABC transporter ATP-binding protein n=1 Tax=Alginatibacterium sediminis TaxID=2164068 RepID=A0A420E6V6_9ALTE|nr:ABC transporter ATP-binding protein [Alginatibacterium sediminis]RKF14261.1 ABC transporter ATP-binding protein [Alginatibacterium sediminis]